MLQEILIEEHETAAKGKGMREVPSPASVLHVDNMSDTWSRSSSQPTEISASSSTPGATLKIYPAPDNHPHTPCEAANAWLRNAIDCHAWHPRNAAARDLIDEVGRMVDPVSALAAWYAVKAASLQRRSASQS